MSAREKIIVVLAVLAVGYGVYVLFFENGSGEPPQARVAEQAADSSAIARQVQETISQGKLNQSEYTILAKAREPWARDPFYTRTTLERPQETEEKAEQEVTFTYSGYVEMGGFKFAVINDEEYTVGDELQIGGYHVREIRPDKVVIRGKQGDINVPFVEETY